MPGLPTDCLSRDFTWSEKDALVKQTSQLSLHGQATVCMDQCSYTVLDGPRWANDKMEYRPSVTSVFWSVFQNPIT